MPEFTIPGLGVYVVDIGNATAVRVIERICKKQREPNEVIYVSPAEFQSLKDGVINLIGEKTND